MLFKYLMLILNFYTLNTNKMTYQPVLNSSTSAYFVTESTAVDCYENHHKFPCYCGKLYNSLKNLKRHVKFECNKEAKLKCPYCDQFFKRNDNRLKHVMLYHSIPSR